MRCASSDRRKFAAAIPHPGHLATPPGYFAVSSCRTSGPDAGIDFETDRCAGEARPGARESSLADRRKIMLHFSPRVRHPRDGGSGDACAIGGDAECFERRRSAVVLRAMQVLQALLQHRVDNTTRCRMDGPLREWGGVGPRRAQDPWKAFRQCLRWQSRCCPSLLRVSLHAGSVSTSGQQPPRIIQYTIDTVIGGQSVPSLVG